MQDVPGTLDKPYGRIFSLHAIRPQTVSKGCFLSIFRNKHRPFFSPCRKSSGIVLLYLYRRCTVYAETIGRLCRNYAKILINEDMLCPKRRYVLPETARRFIEKGTPFFQTRRTLFKEALNRFVFPRLRGCFHATMFVSISLSVYAA